MFASCGENGEKPSGEKSDFVVGSWGENQPLSLTERDENENIFIVNDKNETVMDVSKADGAAVLIDEITKEPRMIRIDTLSGTEEVYIDGENPSEVKTYTYEYYDTVGEPLLGSTAMGISGLVDSLAIVVPWYEASSLVDLSTGMVFADSLDASYIMTDGIVAMDDQFVIHFFDKKGIEVKTRDDIGLSVNNQNYNRAVLFAFGNSKNVYSAEALAQAETNKSYYMYSPSGDAFSKYLAAGVSSEVTPLRFLMFYDSEDTASPKKIGLVNSWGETVVEAKYNDFDFESETLIVAYADTQTDFIDKKTLKVVSSKPHAMVYSDGVTNIVQSGEYEYYLSDVNDNPLSDIYSSMALLRRIGEHTYFYGHVPGTQANVLLDGTGQVLFTDTFEGSYTLLDDGTIGVQSSAGEYIANLDGSVVQMFRTYDGYVYDEATGEIYAAEGTPGQSYLSVE